MRTDNSNYSILRMSVLGNSNTQNLNCAESTNANDQPATCEVIINGISNTQNMDCQNSGECSLLYPFNQTIQLDGNATLQALPLNETMPNDIILQLAPASNVTTMDNPLTLQFIPTNQTAYKMTLLPHARPNEN